MADRRKGNGDGDEPITITGDLVANEFDEGSRVIESLVRGEIDIQIKTAHAFPRDMTTFHREAEALACLNPDVAAQCMYALPRAGQRLEGPSVRLAEIIVSCWGNSRSGARVIDENEKNVVAQGVFIDLQRNNAVTFETRRRITNKDGVRYNDDMVNMTANAACSIAYRNAIFHGIPRAFWWPIYMKARATASGTMKDMETRRSALFAYFANLGITEARVLVTLGKKGVDDIDIDDLLFMRGIATAIDEDKRDPNSMFDPEPLITMPKAKATPTPTPKEPEPPKQEPTPKKKEEPKSTPKQEPKAAAKEEEKEPEPPPAEPASDDPVDVVEEEPTPAATSFDGLAYTGHSGGSTEIEWEGQVIKTGGVQKITLAKLINVARKFDAEFHSPGHWLQGAALCLKRDVVDIPLTVFGFSDEDAKLVLKYLSDALKV